MSTGDLELLVSLNRAREQALRLGYAEFEDWLVPPDVKPDPQNHPALLFYWYEDEFRTLLDFYHWLREEDDEP